MDQSFSSSDPTTFKPPFFLLFTSILTTTFLSCLRCYWPPYSTNLFPHILLLLAPFLSSQPLSGPHDLSTLRLHSSLPCLIFHIVDPFSLFTSCPPFSPSSDHLTSLFASHQALLVNCLKSFLADKTEICGYSLSTNFFLYFSFRMSQV